MSSSVNGNHNPESPTVDSGARQESIVPAESTRSSRLTVVALIVALLSAGLAGYAISKVNSSTATSSASATSVEDLDLFEQPKDLPDFIATIEKSIVEIHCSGTGTGFAFDLDV
ncbi:MAG: hypothetical protein ACKOQZ_11510, partial [Actinomycetota bacterium]